MSYKNKKYILSVVVLIILFAVYYIISNRPGFEDLGNMNNQNEVTQSANSGNSQSSGQNETSADQQGSGDNSGTSDTQNSSDLGNDANYVRYYFRNNKLLTDHYEKHGKEMGFDSKEAYEKAASDVVNNPAALHKTEKEDGDFVYYVEETNEFVIVSTDGYLRTYFNPSAGISYYNRQ